MIRSYLKIAFRNIRRNKIFSILNITGLAIGMASAMLILLWINDELGYDRFFTKTARIYQMYSRDKINGNYTTLDQTPVVLAPALKSGYAAVEDAVRFNKVTFLLTNGEKHLNVQGAFADSGFLSVFSFAALAGNAERALNNDHGIVLTSKLAKKMFGNNDAIGKVIRIDTADDFTVTAVLKDLPDNTQFDFEYLLPRAYMARLGWEDNNWTNNFTYTYVLLKDGQSPSSFESSVKNLIRNHSKDAPLRSDAELFLQPLSRVYLYAKSENGQLVDGRIAKVRLFGLIAILILVTACINFMNLSTARGSKRAKEVGIRKVIGAERKELIAQFAGESIFLAMLAFIAALVIVEFSLPAFNNLSAKRIAIAWSNPGYWLFAVAFIFVTGFCAGTYPAFYLSSFLPVKVLKGAAQNLNGLLAPRRILVIFQFAFANVLIISAVVVLQQIKHSQTRDSGYQKNGLVFTFVQGDVDKNFKLIKNELISSGATLAVTRSTSPITKRWSDGSGYQWDGSTTADLKSDFIQLGADADFAKTTGVKIVDGRDIDIYNYPTDSNAMLLNESAVAAMRLKNPVGTVIRRKGYTGEWHVVGVIKNFIIESPYSDINPMIIEGPDRWAQVIHFKFNPDRNLSDNIAGAERIFKKYNPGSPFEYVFADESYSRKFENEKQSAVLAAWFAGLSIFISCLGLFGLATFMTETRVKEIGIRKTLGAGVRDILYLVSGQFVMLVCLAFLMAVPVAWYLMHSWLQNYSYRVDLHWWVFVVTGLTSVMIALITVGYQSLTAAIANPVKSLRSE